MDANHSGAIGCQELLVKQQGKGTTGGCPSGGSDMRCQFSFVLGNVECCWDIRLHWYTQHKHLWSQGWLLHWCACVLNDMTLLQLILSADVVTAGMSAHEV